MMCCVSDGIKPLDYAALVISILSIIISLVLAHFEYKTSVRINTSQLKSVYFNEIFKDHLLNKLPAARYDLTFGRSGELLNLVEFVSEVNQIRRDSIYYMYEDKEYYDKLVAILQDLEDYVVNAANNTMTNEKQSEFLIVVHNKTKSLYAHINSIFLG